MANFFVYILECSDQSYYVGFTDDLEKRISQHNSKKFHCSYTSTRLPIKILWHQHFSSQEEALDIEKKLKAGLAQKRGFLSKITSP